MAKQSDGVRDAGAVPLADEGSGTLTLIGGVPARKVNGAVIRVAGLRVRGVPVSCVTIESGSAWLVMADGRELWTGELGSVDWLRRSWIRQTLDTGTFAGIGRMR